MSKWKVYRGQIIIAAMIARSSLFAYRFTRTAVRILNSTTWRANGPLGLYQVLYLSYRSVRGSGETWKKFF